MIVTRAAIFKTAAVAVAACMAGCVLPPKEMPRQAPLQAESVGLIGGSVTPAPEGWWQSFNDPQLNRLIEQALANSPTLPQAQARLREAIAQTDAAHSRLLPNASLGANVVRLHAPQNYILPPPLAGSPSWLGQVGATFNWDLDFWGKQADAVARARALAQAADLDIENTRLMLAGAVTQAYVELYRSYALVDIAERAERQRQTIIDITRRRLAAGLDTRLELREAEGQLPQARVDRAQAEAAADLAIHQLAALCGQGADAYGSIKRPQFDLDAALPLPTELPINLLARRPDILVARLQVQAADAERLAAKAAFYPNISLQAVAGFGAFGLNNLFSWSGRGYGGGPLISLPLFDGGRLRADYQGSEAELDASVSSYNLTVLQAVQETADQLTRIQALAHERIDQQQTLDATEDAYRIGEERYRAGLSGYLSVLNAETQVLAARRQSVDIISNQVLARVTLLLAIGGSFDPAKSAAGVAAQVPMPALFKDPAMKATP
jgi:NodT family efflux transporter outer membrane factor (OMF) lipoprotein